MEHEIFEPSIQKLRINTNEQLIKFVSDNKSKSLLLNLAKELPYFSLSDEDRKKFWDDGVHFTEEGYGLFGRLVYKTLFP
jgi:hypothetical protein